MSRFTDRLTQKNVTIIIVTVIAAVVLGGLIYSYYLETEVSYKPDTSAPSSAPATSPEPVDK